MEQNCCKYSHGHSKIVSVKKIIRIAFQFLKGYFVVVIGVWRLLYLKILFLFFVKNNVISIFFIINCDAICNIFDILLLTAKSIKKYEKNNYNY